MNFFGNFFDFNFFFWRIRRATLFDNVWFGLFLGSIEQVQFLTIFKFSKKKRYLNELFRIFLYWFFFGWIPRATRFDTLWFDSFLDFFEKNLISRVWELSKKKNVIQMNFLNLWRKISHIRLEINTKGKTSSKVNLFAIISKCLRRCS